METCDQGGCPARATRELRFDNGCSLWACSYHCNQWIPGLPAETRYTLEPATIIT